MAHLTMWSKNSPLCINDWNWLAVKLVGPNNAKIIEHTHFGGGHHSALQKMLMLWWDNTDDCSWKKIIDALEKMNRRDVIQSIEDELKLHSY